MKIKILGLGCMVLVCVSCSRSTPGKARADYQRMGKGDVVVGVAANLEQEDKELWNGMQLAVKGINEAGGIDGRKLVLVKGDDQGTSVGGQNVAHTFGEREDLVAVIGHQADFISMRTAVIYQYYGLPMICPSADSALTDRGLNLIFRVKPSYEEYAKVLADYAKERGINNVVAYVSRGESGEAIVNAVQTRFAQNNVRVRDLRIYTEYDHDERIKAQLKSWMDNESIDALVLAGSGEQAALIVSIMGEIGMNIPVLTLDGMDNERLVHASGEGADRLAVASVFDKDQRDQAVDDFVKRFGDEFSASPTASGAVAYDSVNLLAEAMRKSGSTVPEDIVATLHGEFSYTGVIGKLSFDHHGNPVGSDLLMIKTLQDGELNPLP